MVKTARTSIRRRSREKGTASLSSSYEKGGIPGSELAQYITTRQAAELLGVTRFQVFHLITAKRIQGVKLGHDWLVLASSVEEYYKTKSARGRPATRAAQIQIR